MKLSTMSVTALSLLTAIYCNVTAAEQLPELKQVAATVPLKNSDDQSLNQIKLAIPQESLTDLRLKQQVTFSVDEGAPFPITFNDLVVNPGESKTTTVPFNQQGTATLSVYSVAGVEGVGKYTISVPVTKMDVIGSTPKISYTCSEGTLSGTSCVVTTYSNVSPVTVYEYDQFRCPTKKDLRVEGNGTTGACTYSKFIKFELGAYLSGSVMVSGVDLKSIDLCYDIGEYWDFILTEHPSGTPGHKMYERKARRCTAVYEAKGVEQGTYIPYRGEAPDCPSGQICYNGYNKKVYSTYCPSGSRPSGSSCLKPTTSNVDAKKVTVYTCPEDYTLISNNQCKG